MMKRIDVMIWKFLVDNCGDYVSSIDICCSLGLSRRQLLTRITKLKYPHVIKEDVSDDRMTFFKLDCDPAEAQLCTIRILSDYYNCPEDRIRKVVMSIPTGCSVTLDEIAGYDPNFSVREVTNIINIMPGVTMTKTWSKNRYRREEYV